MLYFQMPVKIGEIESYPKKLAQKNIYLYFGNVFMGVDPCLGSKTHFVNPPWARAIPRWNRLGKKNPASRAPRARSARKRVPSTT